ncbi:MAG TPA: 2OG-Fe(II) oxygenase [Tepidisphaeraceae bacterium]|nr:2OG-Fe(II) oxygenase [Tepidisphaeraceae bacterium]
MLDSGQDNIHHISDNLFTVSSVFTEAECADLIVRAENMGFEAATVATTGGPKMLTNVRNNDRVTFDDPALAASVWERIREYAPHEIDGAVAVGLNERFRFYRYDPSQRFNAHRDGVVVRSPTEKSRLTFMIYLNEGSESGETVFYSETRIDGLRQVVATVKPAVGMGLFFAHEWWHEGAKVLSGRKYVLRTDVMYRAEK